MLVERRRITCRDYCDGCMREDQLYRLMLCLWDRGSAIETGVLVI